MASRILANLLVAGGAMVFKAATTAYKQAIINASKTGVTAEGLKQASKKNQLSLEEARKILGVDSSASWDEIVEKYHKMFEANEKNGSFYLQSKIYRAHERIKDEFESSHDESRKEDNGDTQSM